MGEMVLKSRGPPYCDGTSVSSLFPTNQKSCSSSKSNHLLQQQGCGLLAESLSWFWSRRL